MILPEHEANRILAGAGIPMISMRTVSSLDEARQEAAELGYPVVLKLSSSLHTHKTEIGGVALDLREAPALEDAFRRLHDLRAQLDPGAVIIIEPMAGSGAELFVGYQRRREFGPVLSFGLGGVFLELFKDVAFRLLPAGAADFREMLSELKSWPKVRDGFRGLPPVDEERVVRLLEQVAAFVLDHPEIVELDLNPVIMDARGATVTDATIVLEGS